MNWATLAQHAVPALQALHARRRNHHAVHRPLAGGHSRNRRNELEKQPGAPDRCHGRRPSSHWCDVPARVQGHAIQPMEGVSLRPAFDGRAADSAAADFWEHEGNKAVRCRQVEARVEHLGPWELYDMAADRIERTTSRPGMPTSSRRSRRNGMRGPSAPTSMPGRGRVVCLGATRQRLASTD